jgi:hypothetical protein
MYVTDDAMAAKVARIVMQQLVNATGLQAPPAIAGKAAGSTPGGSYGHGPGGLFGNPALERPLYSAVISQPFSGLQYVLPVRGTTVTDPLDGIITGVTATTGNNPSGVCDDPPTTGLIKLCQHSFPLGLFSRQTPVFDVRYGNRIASRGEHRDFQVFGDPFKMGQGPFSPSFPATTYNDAANTNDGKIIWAWMVAWARDFAETIYTGNPANNTAGGGYKEFYGLNRLINTGYRDAETGVACPAADSTVFSFANQNVRTSGASIVQTMLQMYYILGSYAARMNLAPARWVLTMPESLFYELTAIWPCSYLTDGCSFTQDDGKRVVVDAGDQIRMRDEMRGDLTNRTGQHLKMFGQNVPVIIDDAIVESGLGAGVQSSSIYFIPLQVLGGQYVTYMEYMDYNAIDVPTIAKNWAGDGDFTVTDGGRFLIHKKPPTNTCVQIAAWTEPRLKLLTPFLAGRIDNVAYNRLPGLRSGDPDSPYFVNGGSTNRNQFAPSYYSPTA